MVLIVKNRSMQSFKDPVMFLVVPTPTSGILETSLCSQLRGELGGLARFGSGVIPFHSHSFGQNSDLLQGKLAHIVYLYVKGENKGHFLVDFFVITTRLNMKYIQGRKNEKFHLSCYVPFLKL